MSTAAERTRDRIYRKRRAPDMGAGDLNTRVTLQRVGHDGSALPFLETYACRQDQGVREHWRSGETRAELTTRFTVRWSPATAGITPRDRIVCDGQTYEIVSTREGRGRRKWVEVATVRRTDRTEISQG